MTTAHPSGHATLVEHLYERGLLDEDWRAVWHAVPREPFIPQRIWRQDPTECVPITTEAERLDLIHSDEPVVIQLDDGHADGPGIATSSNSQPSTVARMLRLLDVESGHRVLEIGTASGHVAALLSRRLGDAHVYSIEIDPGLAHHAAATLRAAGYTPNLACGDGACGWPDEAPFDRLIATCALRHIPGELVQQVSPGGLIVVPVARDFWSGALVQLRVGDDGTASGFSHSGALYMPMRSHRAPAPAPVDDSTARASKSTVHPRQLLQSLGFALYAGTRLPDVRLWHSGHKGAVAVWAQDRDGSATSATCNEVWQYGPRELWSDIERIWAEYDQLGRPELTEFGLTVRASRQEVWMHDPSRVIEPATQSAWMSQTG
ncbi:methyltransferase domain-containing protein [Streptomyces sp. NPDC093546]|uniref:methyltransferase domain-containing protein n=1 Tax=Streptomyces sp. NPDC093546 TaxID=3366040 RepID=UPI0037FD2311